MSATNRGGKRCAADFYRTPKWPVRRLLERCGHNLPHGGLWLEPGAGDGAIIESVALDYGRIKPIWTAVELREECRPQLHAAGASIVHIGDFLKFEPQLPMKFDVAMGNPAFSIAMETIQKCITVALRTILLLRLDFLGSAKRCAFFRDHMPDVYVLPNRPCFVISVSCAEKKKTGCDYAATFDPRRWDDVPECCPKCVAELNISTSDSCDYAWFDFASHRKTEGRVVVLDETSPEERRAA
jgi:hypothetical protein